jgi:hypothetical protein
MTNINPFHQTRKAGLLLSASILALMTGCVARVHVEGPPAAVYVAPSPVETTVVVQDDYVYYPGYNVYYNTYRHQYAYQEGGAWVSRPAPRGVSVNVLLASPSVRMDFHDSPAQHHVAVAQKYPRSWTPPASNRGQKAIPRDDKGEERNGR